jgi:hypothetical protein
MPEEDHEREQVDQFILEEIDSVPHLEALLLLWNSRPKQWPMLEMAKALYISPDRAQPVLQDLIRSGFVLLLAGEYAYDESYRRSDLIEKVDRMYRRELVRISTMIHHNPSAAVRAFARAFRFKKD